MTSTWIRLRLGLLLIAIFLLGAVAGHLASRRIFAPSPELPSIAKASSASTPDTEEPQSKKTTVRATRTVMAQYRAALSLTDEQMEELKPLFKETGIEMSHLPKGSALRLTALESFHKKIRPHLTPQQQKLCNEILERARVRTSEKN